MPGVTASRSLDAMLRRARTAEEVEDLLQGLAPELPEVREAVLGGYQRLATASGRRKDQGCAVRAALLRGLGHGATADDVSMLVTAVDTREFAPPSYTIEVAARLRAAALVALVHADAGLAAYHACALLDDADPFSGDPALTAAQVLGSQHVLPPLYAYAASHESGTVAAECLRQLAAAPWPIVARLAARSTETRDEVIRLGVIDMLLDHPDREQAAEPLLTALLAAPLDVFRYGAATLVARREVALLDVLRASSVLAPARAEALSEARALLP